MIYWSTLNDAVQLDDERYQFGTTEVWYQTHETIIAYQFGFGTWPWPLTYHHERIRRLLQMTHTMIGSIIESNPSKVFMLMQGQAWSPYNQARRLISRLDLTHTSMSIGDIVIVNEMLYICKIRGWAGINLVTGQHLLISATEAYIIEKQMLQPVQKITSTNCNNNNNIGNM